MGLEANGDEGISLATRARRTEQMATKGGDMVDLKGGTGKTSGVRTQARTGEGSGKFSYLGAKQGLVSSRNG